MKGDVTRSLLTHGSWSSTRLTWDWEGSAGSAVVALAGRGLGLGLQDGAVASSSASLHRRFLEPTEPTEPTATWNASI